MIKITSLLAPFNPTGAYLRTRKTLSQLQNELTLQQKALSKLNQAITLLYFSYENWLDIDSLVNVMNLVSSERKALMFFIIKSGDKHGCWLELELDTKFKLLEIE